MRFETTYDIPNEYLRLLFKGSFLYSSALPFFFFFFFLLHHLLLWSSKEQMDKFRLRALKEPHQKNCTKIRVDLIPCLLRLGDLNTC